MNIIKGIIGSALVLSSAVLCAAKYIAAALSQGGGQWGKEDFTQALTFTPTLLNVAMYCALILGIVFIVMSLKNEIARSRE